MASESTHGSEEGKPEALDKLLERRDSPATGSRDAFKALTETLRDEIIANCEPSVNLADIATLRPFVHDCVETLLTKKSIVLNRSEKRQLIEAIVADLSGS